MGLSQWLRCVDNESQHLRCYEGKLLEEFDSLEQLVQTCVTRDAQSVVQIDTDFFKCLGVIKVHKYRLACFSLALDLKVYSFPSEVRCRLSPTEEMSYDRSSPAK